MKLICSSNSIEGLQKLINSFYYSSSYEILPDLTVKNFKGPFPGIIIIKKKNRYLAYLN